MCLPAGLRKGVPGSSGGSLSERVDGHLRRVRHCVPLIRCGSRYVALPARLGEPKWSRRLRWPADALVPGECRDLRPGQGAAAAGAWEKRRCALASRLLSPVLTFFTPNNSLMLTRLAGENAVEPGLPSSARMDGSDARAAGQHSSRPLGADSPPPFQDPQLDDGGALPFGGAPCLEGQPASYRSIPPRGGRASPACHRMSRNGLDRRPRSRLPEMR